MIRRSSRRVRMGPVAQKLLLLLEAGLALSLTTRPGTPFRIIAGVADEWKAINQQSLRNAIRRLYQSKLVGYRTHDDGSVTLTLTNSGKERVLRYHLDSITIPIPTRWDGIWRMVLFDIPESKREGRKALSEKLLALGFYPIQKSVFMYPYECKDEIDFILEIFELVPYVRYAWIKDIDIALDLKRRFRLR